mmetsp:Transcript_7881/g.7375  ORF Transcript_7881/g.7375 Transcript_7881/m.7375 type:complete len:98 (+) Transcript_7881:154-447(+)
MQTTSYILLGKHIPISEYQQVSSFQERSPLKEISPLSQNVVSNLNKNLCKKFMQEEEKSISHREGPDLDMEDKENNSQFMNCHNISFNVYDKENIPP